MLPDWQNVKRVLVIQLGEVEDLVLTSSALETLRQSLPNAAITLMVAPTLSQIALQISGVEHILVYEGTGFTSLKAEPELNLIEQLSRHAFDAAVIFTNAGKSPYALAYICYLAGIPIRLAQSQEFGGSVLSQWVKLQETDTSVNEHLFLLESAGFPTAGGQLCDRYAF